MGELILMNLCQVFSDTVSTSDSLAD